MSIMLKLHFYRHTKIAESVDISRESGFAINNTSIGEWRMGRDGEGRDRMERDGTGRKVTGRHEEGRDGMERDGTG